MTKAPVLLALQAANTILQKPLEPITLESFFYTAMSSLYSLSLPPCPISTRRRVGFGRQTKNVVSTKVLAAHHGHYDGELVDQDMIVLRKRIHETEMTEGKHEPPSYWMEWEKQYYASHYDDDVCEAVGLLQSQLMKTRPSLALAMAVLVTVSVPVSVGVVVFHMMELAKMVQVGTSFH